MVQSVFSRVHHLHALNYEGASQHYPFHAIVYIKVCKMVNRWALKNAMFIYFIHHQTSNNGKGGLISKKLFDFGQTEYAKSLPR